MLAADRFCMNMIALVVFLVFEADAMMVGDLHDKAIQQQLNKNAQNAPVMFRKFIVLHELEV